MPGSSEPLEIIESTVIHDMFMDIAVDMEKELGWDVPAMVGALEYDHDSGVMSVRPVQLHIEGNPGDFLEEMARHMTDQPSLAKSFAEQSPRFYGMILVCEAWGVFGSAAQLHNYERGNVESNPASVEMRTIYVLDILARKHFIQHIRGKSPSTWSESYQIGGAVFEDLRRITLAITEQIPGREDQVTDLKTMFVPQPQDMRAVSEFHRRRRAGS